MGSVDLGFLSPSRQHKTPFPSCRGMDARGYRFTILPCTFPTSNRKTASRCSPWNGPISLEIFQDAQVRGSLIGLTIGVSTGEQTTCLIRFIQPSSFGPPSNTFPAFPQHRSSDLRERGGAVTLSVWTGSGQPLYLRILTRISLSPLAALGKRYWRLSANRAFLTAFRELLCSSPRVRLQDHLL